MPSELTRKIDMSLKRIETFQRPEGLYLAFSGGKDSVVTKRLLDMAAVQYDAHYRVTSVDPPERCVSSGISTEMWIERCRGMIWANLSLCGT